MYPSIYIFMYIHLYVQIAILSDHFLFEKLFYEIFENAEKVRLMLVVNRQSREMANKNIDSLIIVSLA